MSNWKQGVSVIIVAILTLAFVQIAGSYLVSRLSLLDGNQEIEFPEVEEKVVRQMILQLEPQVYYTIQIDSCIDAVQGQEKIDDLARQGYRIFVSDGPPYKLFVGCIGKSPSLEYLPTAITACSNDIFVQKLILNKTQFQFPVNDLAHLSDAELAELEKVAVLISSYDVILKHSLLLFQDYCYENCSEENWNAMIAQIQNEISLLKTSMSDFLLFANTESLVGGVLNLLSITESYEESLQLIVEKKNTQVVLLSQSCLLDLIAYYHDFIEAHRIINSY